MAKNLYLTGYESRSGKSAIVLGMMELLLRHVRKVAFFRPIITQPQDKDARDQDIDLVLRHFELNIPYEDTYACTLPHARNMINEGKQAALMEDILNKYKELEAKYDFVLCEGTDFVGKDPAFEFDLNCAIAANINSPIMLVVNAAKKAYDEVLGSAQLTMEQLNEKGLDVVACIVNRSTMTELEEGRLVASLQNRENSSNALLTYVLPEERELGSPTVGFISKCLNAKVLYGHGRLDALVDDYVVAAMQVGNFLEYVTPGSLVITPGDRADIILGCLATRVSAAYPDLSGILLTGGISVSPTIHRLLDGLDATQIPVLAVPEHTFKAAEALMDLYGRIEPGDTRKIHTALGHFETCVDTREIANRIVNIRSSKITPKMFEYNLIERAASEKMHIVLPEGAEERILRAAHILVRRKVADITLLGKATEITTKLSELNLDMDATIIQPDLYPGLEDYVQTYYKLRKLKGMTLENARKAMLDPNYFGTMMVYKGDADGMVSGSINTTANTIRPSFEFIRTKPGSTIVSSVFLMCLKDRVLVFGDCAVNPNPTAAELAVIAIDAAHTARIFGIEPRVAMLSYSTGCSGKGGDVELVVEAARIAKERAPDLLLEGPLQYDTAIDPEVAKIKAPDSQVAGRATVFVFPDLNTGNNTYKAVQRAAGAVAIGPVLQGLNKPVNDLSRGCTVPDIVNTVAITAVQAQAQKKAMEQQAQ